MSRVGYRIIVFLTLAGIVSVFVVERGYFPFNRLPHLKYSIRGIDVSRHQHLIDWDALASEDIDFAFIKATEGANWVDPRFEENWSGAARAGIARGAYHFFRFCKPGRVQAAHFLAAAPPEANTLPPSVDVEYTGNCNRRARPDAIRAELEAFIEIVSDAYGRSPLIYADSDAYRRIIAGHFEGVRLWVPTLGKEPTLEDDRDWTFWQHDHQGEIAGISGPVDLNVFAGNRWSFGRLVD